jgi:hypothetical protein
MKPLTLILLSVTLFSVCSQKAKKENNSPKERKKIIIGEKVAPSWVKDLIIYQVNPYAFTSPAGDGDGGGSGTFAALTEKLDYISELGVTGIWLAGFSAATAHFHNIPTVYACYRPDSIDSRLGTKEEFKTFIKKAHERNIKVFLDVITHGVVKESSLFTEHPDWFQGESWGMKDFDYDNAEFRKWWINLWVRYVIDCGADGYRLDGPNGAEAKDKVMTVWTDIELACQKANKPIVVFPENRSYHFRQGSRNDKLVYTDMAEIHKRQPKYLCHAMSMHDSGHYKKADKSYYRIKGSRCVFGYSFIFGFNIPVFMSGEEFNADYIPLSIAQRDLYGGGGTSAWLYASWLQWGQLDIPEKKAMFEDCKKIIKIRNENNDLLHYDRENTNILSIDLNKEEVPNPYVRFSKGEKAIVVTGNYSDKDEELNFVLPLEQMGFNTNSKFVFTELWTNKEYIFTAQDLNNFAYSIPADKTAEGGVRAYKIEVIKD